MDISITTLDDLTPPRKRGRQKTNIVIDLSNYNKVTREAKVGDLILRKSDGRVGEVLDIRTLSPYVRRLIVKLLSGFKSGLIDDVSTYYVLEEKHSA
jgi:hypothetical protein